MIPVPWQQPIPALNHGMLLGVLVQLGRVGQGEQGFY
jgi:hypothetical protein